MLCALRKHRVGWRSRSLRSLPRRDASVFRANLPPAPPSPPRSWCSPLFLSSCPLPSWPYPTLLLFISLLPCLLHSASCRGNPSFLPTSLWPPSPCDFGGGGGQRMKLPFASVFSPHLAPNLTFAETPIHTGLREDAGGLFCGGISQWHWKHRGPLAYVSRGPSSQTCNCMHPHSSNLRFCGWLYPCRNKRNGAVAGFRCKDPQLVNPAVPFSYFFKS